MQAEVDSQKAHFETTYNPTNPESRQLVETAALAFIRTLHLMRAQHELGLQRVRNALPLHDAERQDRVNTLVNHLSTAPQHALNHLQRFTEGCDYLADAFDALAAELKDTGTLTPNSQLHARHLHGLEETTYATTPQLAAFLQNLATLPFPRLPAPVAGEGQGEGSSAQALTTAAQSLLTHLEAQSRSLARSRRHPLARARRARPQRSPRPRLLRPSLEAQRLHRYLTRAQRTYEQAIKTLEATKATATPLRPPSRAPRVARPTLPPRLPTTPRQNEPTVSQPLSHKDFENILQDIGPRPRRVLDDSTYVDFSITPRPAAKANGKPRLR